MRTINQIVIQPNTPNDNKVLWLNGSSASYYNNGTWVTIDESSEDGKELNLPDEEDLTSINNKLKLKDREADATNFQSKGYVILRKNLVEVNGVVKNILTQDMINQPNIIYEIRYYFDLNGGTINIPENCTLKFEGGSLNNGVLDCNYARTINFSSRNVLIHKLSGVFDSNSFNLHENDDISNVIGNLWNNISVDFKSIKLKQTKPIHSNHITCLKFYNLNVDVYNRAIRSFQGSNIKFINCEVDCSNCELADNIGSAYTSLAGVSFNDSSNIEVKNCYFHDIDGNGIVLQTCNNVIVNNNTIHNCSFKNVSEDTDESGDGIEVFVTTNALITRNKISQDFNRQIGRVGIVFENNSFGTCQYNTISGYDRAIHCEICHKNNVIDISNNNITACPCSILLWDNLSIIKVHNNQCYNTDCDNFIYGTKNGFYYGNCIINSTTANNGNPNAEFYNNYIYVDNSQTKHTKFSVSIVTVDSKFEVIKFYNNIVKQSSNNPEDWINFEVYNGYYQIHNNLIYSGSMNCYPLKKGRISGNKFIINDFDLQPGKSIWGVYNDGNPRDCIIEDNEFIIDLTDKSKLGQGYFFTPKFSAIVRNNIFPLPGYRMFSEDSNINPQSVLSNNTFIKYSIKQNSIIGSDDLCAKLPYGVNKYIDYTEDPISIKYIDNQKKELDYTKLRIAINNGPSNKRPINVEKGFLYFDTTLAKPIWWTGTKWVDATGADV